MVGMWQTGDRQQDRQGEAVLGCIEQDCIEIEQDCIEWDSDMIWM